jgi:hypothetical protein
MKARIRILAAEIAAMRSRNPSEATLYNFAFGALYAFERAIALGYLDQWHEEHRRVQAEKISKSRAREVTHLAAHLSAGRSLPSGRWLAGYYYNDALIRTDVCYEQLARYSGKVRSKSDRIEREELQDLAINHGLKKDLIVPWWKRVRRDVNIIKHQSVHTTEGPAIDPENTLRVIEQLIKGVKSVFHKQ